MTHNANETFADFGLRPEIVQALADQGIDAPFPIQSMTLPIALGGQDIIGQAKTGTGKTLGFGLPVLHNVLGPEDEGYEDLQVPGAPQALIVTPTRELTVQVTKDLEGAAKKLSVRIMSIYGGRAYEPQIDDLKRGVDVIVGTPGRLIDLMKQKHLDLSQIQTVVLDEADEMLDLGFLPDVETLLQEVPEKRQTMLFSATMPGAVVTMARRYMVQPTHISAADPEDDSIVKRDIRQLVYRAHHMDKDELLARSLQARGRGLTIIFTRTKRSAARVAEELQRRGFAAGALHGDLGQGAREQALRAFRNGKIDVLVATDVAARGIDVEEVTHVINFQAPDDEKTYLHRIGRTGRAGHKGIAVTLVDWEDVPRWRLIAQALEIEQVEPVETYSASPHLYEDLDIPEDVKGKLPKAQRTREGLDAEDQEELGGPDKQRGRGGQRQGGRSARGGRGGQSRNRNRQGRGGQRKRTRSGSTEPQSREGQSGKQKPRRQRSRTRRRNGEVVQRDSRGDN